MKFMATKEVSSCSQTDTKLIAFYPLQLDTTDIKSKPKKAIYLLNISYTANKNKMVCYLDEEESGGFLFSLKFVQARLKSPSDQIGCVTNLSNSAFTNMNLTIKCFSVIPLTRTDAAHYP